MPEIEIWRSASPDPWHNLAVEELLLDTVGENRFRLYLWQNRDTIVIGKNQNPWKECRAALLEKEGGYLARRLSGGGTVFHDLGNLNFTFLMHRDHYDLAKQAGVILGAVRKLGIPAEMSGRNDLTIDGRKFSGNAFCFRKNSAYHHGTILVRSDFERLAKYLQVSEEKIRSKGIASVRSRVVNLTEYCPELTVETVAAALCREFAAVYGAPDGAPDVGSIPEIKSTGQLDQAVIRQLYAKYASWEWRYGEAPQFDLETATRFPWGGIEIGLKLEKGIITAAAVYSDAMDEAFIGMLAPVLQGNILDAKGLAEKIRGLEAGAERAQWQEDIAAWLAAKEF